MAAGRRRRARGRYRAADVVFLELDGHYWDNQAIDHLLDGLRASVGPYGPRVVLLADARVHLARGVGVRR